jgi:adenylosuccinate synthase
MPSTIEEYAQVEVEYEKMPGWKQSLRGIETFEKLPQNA